MRKIEKRFFMWIPIENSVLKKSKIEIERFFFLPKFQATLWCTNIFAFDRHFHIVWARFRRMRNQ